MDKSSAVKMVQDLRRTAESYDNTKCPSCSRNGLVTIHPECTTCRGTGFVQSTDAAQAYRAKAAQIMTNNGLTEADVVVRVQERVYRGGCGPSADFWEDLFRRTRARSDSSYDAQADENRYNYCGRCATTGRRYCPKCRPAYGTTSHCEYCHRETDTGQEQRTYCDRCGHRTGGHYQECPTNATSEKRGRGPSSKAYQNDPGKYWYEQGYHAGKAGASEWRVDTKRSQANAAGWGSRFQQGYESGRRKAGY